MQGSGVQKESRNCPNKKQDEGKVGNWAWVTETKADEDQIVYNTRGVKESSKSRQELWEYWRWVVKKSKLEVINTKK